MTSWHLQSRPNKCDKTSITISLSPSNWQEMITLQGLESLPSTFVTTTETRRRQIGCRRRSASFSRNPYQRSKMRDPSVWLCLPSFLLQRVLSSHVSIPFILSAWTLLHNIISNNFQGVQNRFRIPGDHLPRDPCVLYFKLASCPWKNSFKIVENNASKNNHSCLSLLFLLLQEPSWSHNETFCSWTRVVLQPFLHLEFSFELESRTCYPCDGYLLLPACLFRIEKSLHLKGIHLSCGFFSLCSSFTGVWQ